MALMLDQRLSPTDTQLGRHWTLVRPPALGQSYSTVVVCFPWRGLGWNDSESTARQLVCYPRVRIYVRSQASHLCLRPYICI